VVFGTTDFAIARLPSAEPVMTALTDRIGVTR
jgi:hypothetical protein